MTTITSISAALNTPLYTTPDSKVALEYRSPQSAAPTPAVILRRLERTHQVLTHIPPHNLFTNQLCRNEGNVRVAFAPRPEQFPSRASKGS